jgi:hypothetical protein
VERQVGTRVREERSAPEGIAGALTGGVVDMRLLEVPVRERELDVDDSLDLVAQVERALAVEQAPGLRVGEVEVLKTR